MEAINQQSSQKELLINDINIETIKKKYYYKRELQIFCKTNKLQYINCSKQELENIIEYYLKTGNKLNIIKEKVKKIKLDSNNNITRDTKVVNFKLNKITREFFIKEIGPHFYFNSYLRNIMKNKITNLTYNDLIIEWIKQYGKKKYNRGVKNNISSQYNFLQFQRDFSLNEKEKSRKDCLIAWKLIKSSDYSASYENYKKIKDQL